MAASTQLLHLPPPNTPPSPFTLLLHLSKFASYDPSISQVYTAPAANASRGDFGLKRPLFPRRPSSSNSLPSTGYNPSEANGAAAKNAFIRVKHFDSGARQTEWNSGEAQVRFLRRWEEVGVHTGVKENVRRGWAGVLGNKIVEWEVDSEFAAESRDEGIRQTPVTPNNGGSKLNTKPASLYDSPITPGPNGVGPIPKPAYAHLTPNIDAMSPREFERFLNQLRKLRPKFQQYIHELGEREFKTKGVLKDQPYKPSAQYADLDREAAKLGLRLRPAYPTKGRSYELYNKSLYEISQNQAFSYHRTFIEEHMHEVFGYTQDETQNEAQNATPSLPPPIEQRPHPSAGLLYSHPSPLTSHFLSPPQPGVIIQDTHALPRERIGKTRLVLNAATASYDTLVSSFSAAPSFDNDPGNSMGNVPDIRAEMEARRSNTREKAYLASFAGVTALLKKRDAPGKRPVLSVKSAVGVHPATVSSLMKKAPSLSSQVAKLAEEEIEGGDPSVEHAPRTSIYDSGKATSGNPYTSLFRVANQPALHNAPRVVSYNAQGLKGAKLSLEVRAHEDDLLGSDAVDFSRENPFDPGSRDYVCGGARQDRVGVPLSLGYAGTGIGVGGAWKGGRVELLRRSRALVGEREGMDEKVGAGVSNEDVMRTLQGMVGNKYADENEEDGEEEEDDDDDDWDDDDFGEGDTSKDG